MLVEGPCGRYGVTLINPNGSGEETITQIISAVDQLGEISNNIFAALKSRLDEQRSTLVALDKRLDVAKDKVAKVKGGQQALRILSPAKYPEPEACPRLLSLPLKPLVTKSLSHDDQPPSSSFPLNLMAQRESIPKKFDAPVKHMDELLACFHVREAHLPSLGLALAQGGLGTPTQELELVDSFLLFNTGENPYENYQLPGKRLTDKLLPGKLSPSLVHQPPQQLPLGEEDEEEDDMDDDDGQDDFFYSPSTLQIPELELPTSLKDLPGIVQNLDFSPMDTHPPAFFPFAQKGTKTKTKSKEKPKPSSASQITSSTTPTIPSQPSSYKKEEMPNPIAPISKIANKSQIEKDPKPKKIIAAASTSTSSVPPPPPPPPPAPTLPPPISSTPAPTPAAADDTRSSLMAAIRAAGGAGKASLRSAQEKKYEAKKKKLEEKENLDAGGEGGVDLMADLKNTLAMRRKGISGIQGQAQQGATQRPASVSGMGDIMQKLASTIPALEQSGELGEESSEEENDDWD